MEDAATMLPRLNSAAMNPAGQPFRLRPEDAVRYAHARQGLLAHEWEKAGTPEGAHTITPAAISGLLADQKSATLGIEAAPGAELIAIATITRTDYARYAHRARLVGVYVDPRERGKGLGEIIVTAAIDVAREWNGVEFVDLCVSDHATPAQRLYRRLGFVEWGRQSEATDYLGRRFADIHMSLRLNGVPE
jgi:ribosomal protein S18 acetylase RimI-like enzyme